MTKSRHVKHASAKLGIIKKLWASANERAARSKNREEALAIFARAGRAVRKVVNSKPTEGRAPAKPAPKSKRKDK